MDSEVNLPPPPEEPLPSDCCGNGCSPCVLDIYQEEFAMWEAECARIKNGVLPKFSETLDEDENMPDDLLQMSRFSKLNKVEYIGFTILAISQETHNSLRIRFHLPKSQSLGLSVGQHIILRAASSKGSYITRQYTPISPVHCKGHFEFIFKVYPWGQMSSHISSWQVGDTIYMRGPSGHFEYIPNKYRKVLMVCAGTGIAPMCQVIHSILDNEEDETLIRLIYACQNYLEILLKPELQEWKRYWNFSSVFVLSQEPEKTNYSYGYGEQITKGRIDESILLSELGDHLDKTQVLICGTRSFDSHMLTYVRKLGVAENAVHKF